MRRVDGAQSRVRRDHLQDHPRLTNGPGPSHWRTTNDRVPHLDRVNPVHETPPVMADPWLPPTSPPIRLTSRIPDATPKAADAGGGDLFDETAEVTSPTNQTWVIRDIDYTDDHAASDAPPAGSGDPKQRLHVYVPLHLWSANERPHVYAQIRAFVEHIRLRRGRCPASQPPPPVAPIAEATERSEPSVRATVPPLAPAHARWPIVLYVHGGSWMMGDPSQKGVHDVLKVMSRQSRCITVAVGYRLCRMQSWAIDGLLVAWCVIAIAHAGWSLGPNDGRASMLRPVMWALLSLFFLVLLALAQYLRWTSSHHPFPTQVHDVAQASRWIHRHASYLGGDPSRMAWMGHSAGAHLLTTLYASPDLWARTAIPRTSVCGLVAISGPYSARAMQAPSVRGLGRLVFGSDLEHWNAWFPCELIDAHRLAVDWPPVLMLSAEYDYGLGAHSRHLYRRLRTVRCPCLDWQTIQDVNHFSITAFWSFQHHRIAEYVALFLHRNCGIRLQNPKLVDLWRTTAALSAASSL